VQRQPLDDLTNSSDSDVVRAPTWPFEDGLQSTGEKEEGGTGHLTTDWHGLFPGEGRRPMHIRAKERTREEMVRRVLMLNYVAHFTRRIVLPLLAYLFILPVLAVQDGVAQSLPDFHRIEDVIYGRKAGMALTLDVFQPATPNGYGVVFVVDGAWFSAHDPKPNMPSVQPDAYKSLLHRGYTVFAVVLSSQPEFTIPQIIPDLRRAVRFIRHNAAKYDVKPDYLGIVGISAGGQLTLMIATQAQKGDTKASDPVEREDSSVQAVVCFFPPTDFLNWGGTGIDGVGLQSMAQLRAAFGSRADTEAGRQVLGREISPIYYVTSNLPPTLIIHGDADKIVPVQQSESFVDHARKAGAPLVKLVVMKGKGHGWSGFWDSQEDTQLYLDWFDRNLRGIGNGGDGGKKRSRGGVGRHQ
jgi:acetyl esterase/lipase